MRDTSTYAFGEFELDLGAWRLRRSGVPVEVEPKAIEVLALLVERAGEVVTKSEILDTVWKDATVTENAMVRVIANLRSALGDDAKEPRCVETVHTRGYRFIAPVERRSAAVVAAPATVAAPPSECGDAAPTRARRGRGPRPHHWQCHRAPGGPLAPRSRRRTRAGAAGRRRRSPCCRWRTSGRTMSSTSPTG